jgi:multidrug transporter EmrE-like cation transporter
LVRENAILITGLAAFASAAVFYFLALRSIPLTIAYPTMVVASFLIVNCYALLYLNEQITPLQMSGYALIIVGLLVIYSFGK